MMTSTWQLKSSNSIHFDNSVLYYLYAVVDGLVVYAKARAFKAKAGQSQGQEIWAVGQGLDSITGVHQSVFPVGGP